MIQCFICKKKITDPDDLNVFPGKVRICNDCKPEYEKELLVKWSHKPQSVSERIKNRKRGNPYG